MYVSSGASGKRMTALWLCRTVPKGLHESKLSERGEERNARTVSSPCIGPLDESSWTFLRVGSMVSYTPRLRLAASSSADSWKWTAVVKARLTCVPQPQGRSCGTSTHKTLTLLKQNLKHVTSWTEGWHGNDAGAANTFCLSCFLIIQMWVSCVFEAGGDLSHHPVLRW